VGTGSFTAPASGHVLVTVALTAKASPASVAGLALAATGTVTPIVGTTVQPGLTTVYQTLMAPFYVTGLTSGNSYNFDVLYAVNSGGTVTASFNNNTSTTVTVTGGGPAVVTVVAAQ